MLVISLILCVPNSVNADEMSDEFKSYLNEDGKLVVNSARVESDLELRFVFEYLFLSDENGDYLNTGICFDIAEDMNSVDFTIHCCEKNEETHNVEIVYTYDEKIKSQVDGYLNKIPEDLEYFEVSDLEVINYWLNGGNMINYSSELKSLFDYKNFKIDFRAGGGNKFYTEMTGIAQFTYDGTIYGVRNRTGVLAKHIIYIDESVGNTKEDVVAAVQKRIDDYVGKGKVTVKYEGQGIYNLFYDEYESKFLKYQEEYNNLNEKYQEVQANENEYCVVNYDATLCQESQQKRDDLYWKVNSAKNGYEDYKGYKESFVSNWNDPNSEIAFLKDAYNDWYFSLEIGEETYEFIVIKDSSKMVTPSIKTSDVLTNVEISTSATLPLDTAIQAKKLTSGTEYERILSILNLTDNLTFDLKLYSSSAEKYITKLEDGSFEVKIPIPENFEGKDLVVYYVTEEGKTVEYEVTVKDGYAVFKTDHFSIYSLAEKKESSQEGTTGTTEENPKTGDNIVLYLTSSVVSLFGLGTAIVYSYKRKQGN